MAKTETWSRSRFTDVGSIIESMYFFQASESSPRVNGKLALQSNPFSRQFRKNLSYETFGSRPDLWQLWALPPGIPVLTSTPAQSRCQTEAQNMALARFRGKLYEGGASLGVTLGSYKRSADMIRNRAGQLARQFENPPRGVKLPVGRQSAVSGYLEWIFGWKPLLEDIWKACTSVIQLADARESVSGKGSSYFEENLSTSDYEQFQSGLIRVTVNSVVTISNPNLWLLERAGLLNPAAVAWDLIPWSFLVNLVTNCGQLVNSITDYTGLAFGNEAVTTSTNLSGSRKDKSPYPPDHPFHGWGRTVYDFQSKGRTVGAIPKPSFQFKVPEASWETAAMAASLMVQKVRRVDNILSVKSTLLSS